MKLKRIFPLFLALVMVLSTVVAVPLGVSAETTEISTGATGADESTAGYKAENVVKITAETIAADDATSVTMTQYAAGSTSAKYVSINSADELVLFSDWSNTKGANFSGKVIYLTKDIDMTGKTMYPIAFRTQADATYVNAVAFRGTFDGQGYTISNLNMTMNSLTDVLAAVEERWGKNYTTTVVKTTNEETQEVTETTYTANSVNGWGLFCYLDSDGKGNDATIKNLRLDDTCHFETKQNGAYSGTGSIVGTVKHANVRVNNCYSAATVIDCSTGSAGGFFGRGETKITASNLTFEGNVTAGNHAGGIMGYNSGFDISNTVSAGVVTSKNIHAAGFAARLDGTGVITNSINDSELIIDVDNATVYMAGFVAKMRKGTNLTLTNVTNKSTNMHLASGRGIVGRIFTDNFYNLAVTGTAIGYQQTAAQATLNCTNCKGVELDAGYSADRIKKLTGGTEITAATTKENLNAASLFYISTPAGLQNFATLINAGGVSISGKTVYLTADIDMSGYDWKPIGLRPNGSMGSLASGVVFDGQGYTISNMICDLTYAESAAIALFGVMYSGTIRNVVLDESCAFVCTDGSTGNQSSAAILAYNGGAVIANCKTSAYVYGYKAGGITGGGPAGSVTNGAYFCTNYGTVQGYMHAAGINSGIDDGANAMNCVNYGSISQPYAVSVSNQNHRAAAINVGNRGGHQIRNNINYGTVAGTNGSFCAMIIATNVSTANSYGTEIRNNTNYGILSTSTNSGGAGSPRADMAIVVGTDDNQYAALVSNTTRAAVWGNKTVGNYVGYNTDKINKVSDAVMAEIADIKDVWTIADGAATLNAAYTKAPNVLKITDKAGMRVLSAVVYFGNSLKGTTVYLANDIDMTDMIYDATDLTFAKDTTFLPIGHIDGSLWTGDNQNAINVMNFGGLTQEAAADPTYTKYFSGNFDGQGYAIKNWTVDNTTANSELATRIGLFGLVHMGVVQNVVFDESNRMTNASAPQSRWTGVVVQATCSLIDNVWNRSDWMEDVTASNGGITGGIAAFASCTNVISCTNDGAVVKGIRGSGGIVGWGYNSVGIANCRNNGEVSSTFRNADHPEWIPSMNIAGGIIGVAGIVNNHTRFPRIINCVNNGVVTVCDPATSGETTYTPWAGSIVGYGGTAPQQIRPLNNVDYANADLGHCGQNKSFNTGTNVYQLLDLVEEDNMLDDMLHTRYQAKDTETVGEKTVQDVRLVATIDGAVRENGEIVTNYKEAGFILTNSEGQKVKLETETVYSSLLAMDDENKILTCKPEEYGACTSQYFFAYVLNNVAEGTFTAQSYVVTQNGTMLMGDVLTITIPTAAVN